MNDTARLHQDSPAWRFFVMVSFTAALSAVSLGLLLLPVDIWIKGYMAIGIYWAVSSTIMLSKTLRDSHESSKIINKISEARTEKMLKDFDLGN